MKDRTKLQLAALAFNAEACAVMADVQKKAGNQVLAKEWEERRAMSARVAFNIATGATGVQP